MRTNIPLWQLSPKQIEIIQKAKAEAAQPKAIVKPQRMLGACWTSDKVALRKPVVMCEECWRKYRYWWRRSYYRPDWGWRFIVNCDGCSTVGIHGTLFMPEEGFYGTLGPAHGRYPNP